jgi:hypothetical protein
MSAVDTIEPPPLQSTLDDLRLEAIVEFCDLAASCARSASEAAWRGERRTLRCHLEQLRMATRDALQTFNSLGKEGGVVE